SHFSSSLSRIFLILIPLFLILILDFPHPYPTFPHPYPGFSSSSSPLSPSAKPRLDNESCPGQQNWTEGREGVLECRARGRPEPEVKCSKDGNSIAAGIPHLADRAQAGTYRCQASNALGTAERDVTLWVQCAWGSGGSRGYLGFGGSLGYL
ncbi:ICAM5 protein, partial [Oreocharis arfaki]|nr:ICAM5 protein [Oreocharis arfaki]